MVPKESGFNQSETASGVCARIVGRFPCSPAMARDGEVIQRQFFCNQGDTLPFKVWLRNNQTARNDATIIRSFRQSYFHISYRRNMPSTLIWLRQSLGGACQSSAMVTLLNSLSFVFKI